MAIEASPILEHRVAQIPDGADSPSINDVLAAPSGHLDSGSEHITVVEARIEPMGDADVWRQCCALLEVELAADEFTTWIRPIQFCRRGEGVWLGVPNRYVHERLESHYLERIHTALQTVLDADTVDVTIAVGSLDAIEHQARKETPPQRIGTRGRTSESVGERAQLNLFNLERRGQFVAVPITPNNEFPTLLTRLPIFVPGRAKKQRERLDRDNALPFETSWGMGRKFGPPLTVYDEDTLIALGRLRQNMLIGDPGKMPYPISTLYREENKDDVHVHVVYCMLSDIQDMCGTSKGGRNNKLRLESIKRLAGTKIEFNKETRDKVKSTGTTIDLIHVKWDVYEDNAILYIQFSPIMATWLESAYTYIDWNLRKQLRTDVGKAVHRFLSGQPRRYAIFTKKLQATIGHTGPYKHFMANLREAMAQFTEAGWVQAAEITGNGRKQPHKLELQR